MQPRSAEAYPGNLRQSSWWDFRCLGHGQYCTWTDEDMSTVCSTIRCFELWLSVSGLDVERRTRKWVYSGSCVLM